MPARLTPSVLDRFRIEPGSRFRVSDHDTDWLPDELSDVPKEELKARSADLVARNLKLLEVAQDQLYADDRYAVLLVFQAMDAAGKDGTIKHVMSGVNPQGCQVSSFKIPSAEEIDHDYLWRYAKALPERGRIGIFNRSYYEEVLVVRVHPPVLLNQRIPGVSKPTPALWRQRYEEINDFEKHLTRNGTQIIKFFLNVSKDEQRQRFLDRLDDPAKNWKFSTNDIKERGYWADYMKAYEEAISATSTEHAPWYVIPADRKYVMRSLVSEIVTRRITRLKVAYPTISDAQRAELAAARELLLAEETPRPPRRRS